ncbi:hypothetical protein OAA19_03530 [Rubripirellula sp.]|nr:hypothetical protein [Rubripirellula sp.]MDB4339163.1 hypothetical protein [Rubripirellula sp.]
MIKTFGFSSANAVIDIKQTVIADKSRSSVIVTVTANWGITDLRHSLTGTHDEQF